VYTLDTNTIIYYLIENLLRIISIIPPDSQIARPAGSIRRTYRLMGVMGVDR
jgi:predicted nucleic acid-binding protein